jgi:uncharacterized membrane protein HdeD (DUF308 family)
LKVILTILAGLVILFCGGCALMLRPLGGLEFIPLMVILLNGLVILALWRNLRVGRWALLTLGILDLLLGALLFSYVAAVVLYYGGGRTRQLYLSESALIWSLTIAFLLKGVLSIVFFRRSANENHPS